MHRTVISESNVVKSLGYGSSYTAFITSLVLAIISFFYVFTVANLLGVNIFFLQGRVTYLTPFNLYLISQDIDQFVLVGGFFVWLTFSLKIQTRIRCILGIVLGIFMILLVYAHFDVLVVDTALLSIPLCAALLVYNKSPFAKIQFLNDQTSLIYINHIGLVAVIVAAVSAITVLSKDLHIFPNNIGYLPMHDYAYQFYDLVSDISPIAILVLVSCVPVKIIINASQKALLDAKNRYRNKKKKNNPNENYLDAAAFSSPASIQEKSSRNSERLTGADEELVKIRKPTIIVYLVLFMLLTVTLAIIPHLPAINRNHQQIGTDSDSYVNWTKALSLSSSPVNFTKQAFLVQSSGERPLSLIFIYAIVKLTTGVQEGAGIGLGAHSAFLVVIEYLPLILGPALVFVTFFLTRELTSNDKTSLFASFLTAVSFQILIGIYAGYYANWIGLIFGYLSIIFLIKSLKKRTIRNLALFLILTIGMLLSHQYTWVVFVIVILIFLIALIFVKLQTDGVGYQYSRTTIILLIVILLLPVVLEFGRTVIIGSSGGISQDISKAKAGLSLKNFAQRWSTLKNSVFIYLGGQLSNFIILSLGLYWLYICKIQEMSSLFIFIFLSIGLFPIFFGDQLTQGRTLYDLPFQIPAALALTHLRERQGVLLPAICIWLVLLSIRTAANFYYLPSPT